MSPTCSTCSYNCICIVYLYLNLNQSVLKCNIPEEFRRIYQTRFQTGSHIVPIQRKNTMRKTADRSSITELHGSLFFKGFFIFLSSETCCSSERPRGEIRASVFSDGISGGLGRLAAQTSESEKSCIDSYFTFLSPGCPPDTPLLSPEPSP